MATKQDFIVAARSYIGTKFHHQGRVPNVGLDCAGVVVCAAAACGITLGDIQGYGRQPDGNALFKHCEANGRKVSRAEAQAGDVILMSFERDPQHLAVISEIEGDRIRVIHAWLQARGTVENDIDQVWMDRIVAIFRLEDLT
jgi:cell wall-associated NlpC family hydrolase